MNLYFSWGFLNKADVTYHAFALSDAYLRKLFDIGLNPRRKLMLALVKVIQIANVFNFFYFLKVKTFNLVT